MAGQIFHSLTRILTKVWPVDVAFHIFDYLKQYILLKLHKVDDIGG